MRAGLLLGCLTVEPGTLYRRTIKPPQRGVEGPHPETSRFLGGGPILSPPVEYGLCQLPAAAGAGIGGTQDRATNCASALPAAERSGAAELLHRREPPFPAGPFPPVVFSRDVNGCAFRPRLPRGQRRPGCGAPVEPGSDRCHEHRRPWLDPIDHEGVWLVLARRQREEADLASCVAALAALLASADRDRSMPTEKEPNVPAAKCLGSPPVPGCNCGTVLAPAAIAAEHGARVLAQARLATRSTAASMVLAHAGALRELAPTLHWPSDRQWCHDLAAGLIDFAHQLPVCDGGDGNPGAGHA